MIDKNLQCCGNCKHQGAEACPLREEIDKMFGVPIYEYPEQYGVCDNWTFDGITKERRMIA